MTIPRNEARARARLRLLTRSPETLDPTGVRRTKASAYLTTEGKKMLEARLDELRVNRIPALIVALHDRDRDGRVDAEYVRAVREAAEIDELIMSSGNVEDLPRVGNGVALGDRVTVLLDSGERLEVIVVDPAEAPLDQVRISSESPLSKALLGRRIGAEVTVPAPAGEYRCVILNIRRV